MKPTEFIVENSIIAQEADDMHRDHEVQMARSQMYSSAQAAIEIHRLLRDISEMEGLEGWVQSKLTLASQYLESVRDYLKYEAVSQEPEMMTFAESAANYALNSLLDEDTFIPGQGGMSGSISKTGDVTTRFDSGGLSVSQTKTPGGFTKQTTADYDMGPSGSASLVQQAPQKPGQLAGTTTVTRTAMPTVPGQGSATAASGSAVQGVAFGGASGKNVGNNVVTTGDADLAQQAKAVMPAQNTNLEEDDDDVIVRKPGGDYADPRDGYSRSRYRDRILSTPPGEINPGLQKYAERNTPRKMGDPGLPGAKDNYSSNRPEGARVRDFTIGGQIVGGPPTKIERPGGVPKVEKTPITRFSMPGSSDHDPRLGADLDPKMMMKRSMRESATGGASSSSGVATSMGGPAHKPTSGVPKKLGNSHKSKQVTVGKGVYDK